MVYHDVWSMNLGRWQGIQLRLHVFFPLFAVFTVYLAWLERHQDPGILWLALLSLVILFCSVLLHELGHLIVARRLDGRADALVLGPLGGLRVHRMTSDPQSELLAISGGPLTTLGIVLLASIVAWFFDPEKSGQIFQLLAPDLLDGTNFDPIGVGEAVRLVGWINWWIFVINLLPVFPFDGGRALSHLLQALFPHLGNERAVIAVATFARFVALGLFVASFVVREAVPGSVAPPWLALSLLAVFVFFSARVEEAQMEPEDDDEELFGYDFSQGYTSLERELQQPVEVRPGPITRWLERWKSQRAARLAEIAASEEIEADEILRKMHEEGSQSLTYHERALLQRVSARLRTRQQ